MALHTDAAGDDDDGEDDDDGGAVVACERSLLVCLSPN